MKRAKPTSILLLAALLAAGPVFAEGQPESPPAPVPPGERPAASAVPGAPAAATRYNIDFTDVDIRKVVETVSDITGRNFLVDDRVQGRVMVIGPRALSADEVYQVFLSILQVKGFTVVPAGKVEKIIPSANVANYGVDLRVSRTAENTGDRYLTQIFPLNFAEAEDLRALLAPILPKTDGISSYSPTNMLIVTTTESLLARVAQIVSLVDVPGSREEMRILPLANAAASDIAAKVGQVMDSQAAKVAAAHRAARPPQPGESTAPKGETRIIPDERTNSLIVIADPLTVEKVAELVRKLDIPMPQGGGKVHVYYLQNADALELAKVLSGIPVETTVEAGKTAPGAPAPAPSPPGKAAGIEKVSIIADKATNSLVITCTPEEFVQLSSVIAKLDVPRDQVMVEVLIAEVSLTRTRELGVEWRAAGSAVDGKYTTFGGTSFGEFNNLAVSLPALPDGMVLGAMGKTITVNGVDYPSLGALIRALKTDSDVNILSTPTLVTTDNQQAEIVVGQTVPFQTSVKFDANNNPVTTYDYRDVGLTLRLTPQISKNRTVKLKIFSQLEALVATEGSQSQSFAPTTLKRKADTSLVVADGNTVVLGGMIRDDLTSSASKVPILGDLPLLGALFSNTTTRKEKTNLLIFLTPHIIANAEEAHQAAQDKVRDGNVLEGSRVRELGLDRDLPSGVQGDGPAGEEPR